MTEEGGSQPARWYAVEKRKHADLLGQVELFGTIEEGRACLTQAGHISCLEPWALCRHQGPAWSRHCNHHLATATWFVNLRSSRCQLQAKICQMGQCCDRDVDIVSSAADTDWHLPDCPVAGGLSANLHTSFQPFFCLQPAQRRPLRNHQTVLVQGCPAAAQTSPDIVTAIPAWRTCQPKPLHAPTAHANISKIVQALRTCQMTLLRGAALAEPHLKTRNPFPMRTTSSTTTWEGARPGSDAGTSALAAARASPTRPCRCVLRRGCCCCLWLSCGEGIIHILYEVQPRQWAASQQPCLSQQALQLSC